MHIDDSIHFHVRENTKLNQIKSKGWQSHMTCMICWLSLWDIYVHGTGPTEDTGNISCKQKKSCRRRGITSVKIRVKLKPTKFIKISWLTTLKLVHIIFFTSTLNTNYWITVQKNYPDTSLNFWLYTTWLTEKKFKATPAIKYWQISCRGFGWSQLTLQNKRRKSWYSQ